VIVTALSPLGDWYVIAEYPNEPWEQINGTPLTIRNFCQEIRNIENGRNHNFPYIRKLRVTEYIGDPNAMKAQQPHNRTTIQREYELNGGFDINCNVDNDIALRHNKIMELLFHDPQRKIDSINRAHAYIFKSCRNMNKAFAGYAYKKNQGMGSGLSDKLEELWKDWIDAFGYTVVTVDAWTQSRRGDEDEGDDDYSLIQAGRNQYKEDFE
jgi:hypothetical protein